MVHIHVQGPPDSNQPESEIYFPWFQLNELVLASKDLYNELYENQNPTTKNQLTIKSESNDENSINHQIKIQRRKINEPTIQKPMTTFIKPNLFSK
jgi:hypothetical protein